MNLTYLRILKKTPRLLHKLGFTMAAKSAQQLYQNKLIQYLYNQNASLFKMQNTVPKKDTQNINTIWICWLQGYKNAPILVQKCINQLRQYHKDVTVIDLDNYENYVEIPKFIIKKFEQKIITPTHFSDILRFALMSQQGGIWIDSTYLILQPLPNQIFFSDFFTLSSEQDIFKQWVPEGKWSGNFMKFNYGDPTPTIIFQCFLNYWQKNNYLIDYFLIDFIIKVNYLNNPLFKQKIDQNPNLADQIFLMAELLLKPISEKNNNLLRQDPLKIYKLSHRIDAIAHSTNGTYYEKYISSK